MRVADEDLAAQVKDATDEIITAIQRLPHDRC
jgi:hypothetical protein